uniref:Uncharacterized protein n=1 Tax=Trichuris muris TaxID=70415 RepID=A0A5S6QPH0_TRIMR
MNTHSLGPHGFHSLRMSRAQSVDEADGVVVLRQTEVPAPFVGNFGGLKSDVIFDHRDYGGTAEIRNYHKETFAGFAADAPENLLLGKAAASVVLS